MSTRWEEDSEAMSLAEYDDDPKKADKNVVSIPLLFFR